MTNNMEFLAYYQDEEQVFKSLAVEVIETIKANNKKGEKTLLVLPIGPTGHYPYLVEIINREAINLSETWIINMDEYLQNENTLIEYHDSLSFRKVMDTAFYSQINTELIMPEEQRVIPDPNHLKKISNLINEIGKVDLVIGGIGLNGHVAFNEPQVDLSIEDFLQLPTRIIDIAETTRAVNSLGDFEGDFFRTPEKAVTIGFKEMYQANRIRLGVFRNWHKGVLANLTNLEPTTSFPVSLLKNHPDFKVYAPETLKPSTENGLIK